MANEKLMATGKDTFASLPVIVPVSRAEGGWYKVALTFYFAERS